MYGYAASALRFSLARSVSCVKSDVLVDIDPLAPRKRWVSCRIGNLMSITEAAGFLHPIDATAVMRGGSDLSRSTRSVC